MNWYDDESSGIGYTGSGDQEGDYDMPTNPPYYMGGGDQEGDYDMPTNPPPDYSNEGRNYPTPESTQGPGGSPVNAGGGFDLNKFLSGAGKLFDKAGKFTGDNKGLMALLTTLAGAYAGKQGVRPSSGGGTSLAYTGPSKPLTGTVTQGKYGPLMTYAANGGLMQAYAQGGPVQMESGGFVMTKKSVDGAGGPQGIRSLVPGARMIRGPGTGTSDDVPAVIQGRHGQTPARLSNGEAYIPKQQVQEQGGAKRLYSLMNQLQGAKNA
jgi:hypothetical protein